MWVVLIAGSIGSALRAVRPPNLHITPDCRRGNALKELQRHDEAIACHRRAAALAPQSSLFAANLGVALREAGLPKVAYWLYLGSAQESLAPRFAFPGADKFADLEIRPGALGMPLMEGSLAYAECALHRIVSAGDHSVVLGRVIGGSACASKPLLYFRGSFFSGECLHV